MTIVADTFAGERERHTLETLLASRLSDRAILLGKLSAAVVFEWGITQLVFLVALLPTNILHGRAGLIFYTPAVALPTLILSAVLAVLTFLLYVITKSRFGRLCRATFWNAQTPSLKNDLAARLTKLLHEPFPISRASASGERGSEHE